MSSIDSDKKKMLRPEDQYNSQQSDFWGLERIYYLIAFTMAALNKLSFALSGAKVANVTNSRYNEVNAGRFKSFFEYKKVSPKSVASLHIH